MIISRTSIFSQVSSAWDSACLLPLQQMATQTFAKVQDVGESMYLRALGGNTGKIVEGSVWGGSWALSAFFAGKSLYDLRQTYAIEHPASERCVKINTAFKNFLVDFCSFGGATGHIAHWAHEAQVFSLGQCAYLAKTISYGGGLAVNALEGSYSIYCIYTEGEAILNAEAPAEKEQHKRRICWRLLKLMGNIAMVAWASLGIALLTTGLVVSPILMTFLLGASSFFSISAYFYGWYLDLRYPNPSQKG